MSQIVLIGPGRAGMSIAIAARRAGHEVIGVLGRSDPTPAAQRLASTVLDWKSPLPPADLIVVSVRDDAIQEVAARLRPAPGSLVVHCSGATPISALDTLAETGMRVGVLHPLQTLPDPETGAEALRGASFAISGQPTVEAALVEFVESLGGRPFPLPDSRRGAYHAGASAASNYVTAALAVSAELFAAAGVAFEHARPLVEATVDNCFASSTPSQVLTGPIARGDVQTVATQHAAAAAASPRLAHAFALMARATAVVAGRPTLLEGVLDGDR